MVLRRVTRTAVRLAVLGGLLLGAPSRALAFDPGEENSSARVIQPKKVEEARSHFSKGVSLYDAGSFAAAKAEFEKAYELAPSYKLLYNLGLVQRQLDDPARAIRSLDVYLSQGAWELPDSRVTEVTKIISELQPRVASAKINTNVTAAQVTVDDWFAGETPIEDVIPINPGSHKVTVKRDGYISDSRVISASAADVLAVNFDLKQLPPPVALTRLLVLTALTAIVVMLVLRAVRNDLTIASDEPADDRLPSGGNPDVAR